MKDNVHVYPLNDTFEHILFGWACWCNPRVWPFPVETLIIHQSVDRREEHEWQTQKSEPVA